MKTFTAILFLSLTVCFGADIYMANSAIGSGDGSSAANAKAWVYNTDFTSAGDTLHLVGTITTNDPTYHGQLYVTKSGTVASPITVYFETGAKISNPSNGVPVSINGTGNIVVDGGTNGLVEALNTGTGLLYSNVAGMVQILNSTNVTVKNLRFQNQYLHTDTNDCNPDIAGAGAIYCTGNEGGDLTFTSDTFSNCGWCIEVLSQPRSNVVNNCSFVNYDHGIVPGGTNMVVMNNHFGSASNWDTQCNAYHHDPIHYYGVTNVLSFIIADNVFTNDLGNNNTAMIYLEGLPANVLMYNNLFLQWPSNYLNNGMVYAAGDNGRIFNNTFAGSGVALSGGLTTGGANTVVANNLFNSVNSFVYVQKLNILTFSNNVYANWVSGGNSPWATNGAPYNTFADWQAAVGDANSIYTNITIVNSDGTLPSGSVAIGAGANLSSIFTTDYAGLTRTIPWDVGAYEFTGSNTPASSFNVMTVGGFSGTMYTH